MRSWRCKDQEIDPRLCTVDELMEFSPERSNWPLVAGENRFEVDSTPEFQQEEERSVIADAQEPSLQRGEVPEPSGEHMSSPTDLVDNQCEEQLAAELPRNAELVADEGGHFRKGESPRSGCVGARTGNDPCAEVESQTCLAELSTLEGSRAAEAPQEGDDNISSFFVRRPQEEYSRLESVESSLTLLLRRQAMREDSRSPQGGSRGSSRRGYADMVGASQRGSGSEFEVRVHLPPFDEDSVLVKAVPSIMRVSTLVTEVLRQQGSSSSSSSGPVSWELRLYDEDEEEPDYDCPPFDQNLQVGCLNVSDVALCMVGAPAVGTPPSPPQLSIMEEAGAGVLSPSAVTPEAPGRGILGRKAFDLPKREISDPEVPLSHWSRPEERRQGSQQWSHRRTRSMPLVAVEAPSVPDALPHGHSEAMSVSSYRDLESVRRRPPTPAFFFNVYTASIATEYPVTVGLKGSRATPSECNLVVNRESLHHRAPRGSLPQGNEKDHKKVSFVVPPLLKKLGRHLSLPEAFRSDENFIFIDRCVHDIRHISTDEESSPLSFSITYSGSASPELAGPVELTYQAQTPTERAEIVARLHFLMMLVAKQ